MTHGSLFTGIGGFDLGFERAGIKTIWQVEIDPFCRKVLKKHWPNAQRFEDIRHCHNLPRVDIVSGGFPCQDISNAGLRAGIDGEQSGRWSEMFRVVREVRPGIVVVENVAALLGRGFGRVLGDLASCGYDCEWDCIPASAVGAPHRRDRVWIIAYSRSHQLRNESRRRGRQSGADTTEPRNDGPQELVAHPASRRQRTDGSASRESGHTDFSSENVAHTPSPRRDGRTREKQPVCGQPLLPARPSRCSEMVADADSGRCEQRDEEQRAVSESQPRSVPQPIFAGLEGYERGVLALAEFRRYNSDPAGSGWWSTEPGVGRLADGISGRVAPLRALGNSLVPQIAEWIGRRIVGETYDQ